MVSTGCTDSGDSELCSHAYIILVKKCVTGTKTIQN